MITEQELLNAINACLKDPASYSNCEKLANYFVIHDHLYGQSEFKKPEIEKVKVIHASGESDFLKAVDGMEVQSFLSIMDELITKTIKVINPRIYDGVMEMLYK